ncbi:MAG: glycine/sarcosine/betaine reductase complex component C subunit beta [Desulfurivibrionaceae bacterium]
MTDSPVIQSCSCCLAHVPDLVRYGSKPRREINNNLDIQSQIERHLRSYEEAVNYPPNQTYIGNISPDQLAEIGRPWYARPISTGEAASRKDGRFGEITDQETFLALLKKADVLNPPLFRLSGDFSARLETALAGHTLFKDDRVNLAAGQNSGPQYKESEGGSPLPIHLGQELVGYFHGDERAEGRDDENLLAHHLLENLCSKASGVLALKRLLHRSEIEPGDVDFVISCGEEACGDRYQRGGGGMAKAIAAMSGCDNASGMDIKNFCAAPSSALVTASAMVKAGVFKRVVVLGGGSLAKLGMKFQSFLERDMKILDDCLASTAILVTRDDGLSPVIRTDPGAFGNVPVGASTSDEAVFRHYLLKPLENLGLKCTDIDRFAVELQNPEIMEFAGSGDVARKNYRKIAAMAVRSGQLEKKDMDTWGSKVGMVGFAPTQGHIPSAVPYMGHALDQINRQEISRVMFLARASLFLNRCTDLLDGVSFILEKNPAT